jgi:phage repressor protein C with HTH and peptisase S24 domain
VANPADDELRTRRVANLAKALKRREMRAGDLARLTDSGDSYWHGVLNGSRSFGEKAARGAEEALGLQPGELDNPERDTRALAAREPDQPLYHHKAGQRREVVIPQYRTGGRMGPGGLILRDQPGVIHSWHVTADWVQKNVRNATSPANLSIVTGFGDSMRPLYNPGDPLLVDRGVTVVEFDAIYFFRVGQEGFVKRLQRIPKTGGATVLRAKSDNPVYDPFEIDSTMDFQVFGRVLKVWRGEEF